jgi:hypothetical protein
MASGFGQAAESGFGDEEKAAVGLGVAISRRAATTQKR